MNRPCRIMQIAAAMFPLVTFAASVRADIFQWEYINPADPSQGKQQSTTLAPNGLGVDAVPGANLAGRNLTMAYLIGADLMNADGYALNLTNADLSQANLTNAYFLGALLTDADFTDADVRGAYFLESTGMTLAQLYSTASYQAHDLTGIGLPYINLTGANFAGQNLTYAFFGYATITGADLTGAEVRGASFHGITLAQLYSTASYQAHNLTGIRLTGNDLTGGNFAGQNLTNSDFSNSTLTDADFTGAEVRGAGFYLDFLVGKGGISLTQLYSTASYQVHDLTRVRLGGNDLSGWNFGGQNLTGSSFYVATLTAVNFREANLTNADFTGATLTDADFADADVRGADFSVGYGCLPSGCSERGGLTLAQLYSTASYQAHDLTGIRLYGSNLAGANFAGQNLTSASIGNVNLAGANFREANLADASLSGATLTDADFTGAEVRGAGFYHDFTAGKGGISLTQLYSTASYQVHDLTGVGLGGNDLAGANLAGQNLNNASFSGGTLGNADFTGAVVRGASFYKDDFGTGITLAQLYSTASYQAHDLSGIDFGKNNLAGANFAGQNLSNAGFGRATLTDADFRHANLTNASFFEAMLGGADLTGAEVSGANFGSRCLNFCFVVITLDQLYSTASYQERDLRGVSGVDLAGATTTNVVLPDGHIDGLDLNGGGLLVVRDYDGLPEYGTAYPPIPIKVDQHLAMGPGGTLRMVFEADEWNSTISFAPGIPVTLGGTLELAFADDVNLASQVGRTFDLFNWTGVNPTGAFSISSPYRWDLSNLYTTGEVTLTAVPEPATVGLLLCGVLTLANRRTGTGKRRPF